MHSCGRSYTQARSNTLYFTYFYLLIIPVSCQKNFTVSFGKSKRRGYLTLFLGSMMDEPLKFINLIGLCKILYHDTLNSPVFHPSNDSWDCMAFNSHRPALQRMLLPRITVVAITPPSSTTTTSPTTPTIQLTVPGTMGHITTINNTIHIPCSKRMHHICVAR